MHGALTNRIGRRERAMMSAIILAIAEHCTQAALAFEEDMQSVLFLFNLTATLAAT